MASKKKKNKAVTNFLNKKKYKNLNEFLESPEEEQKEVLEDVVEKATQDQEDLLELR